MLANYTCAGGPAEEVYRTQFTSFGFQFVQIENYPGVPMADALTAHFLGPDFKPAGEFSSSSTVLNAVQSALVASAAANWANDVPSDCPHRERKGYLGDGHHAMESVIANFDAAPGYVKWLRDYRDQQLYANLTFGHQYDPADPTGGFGHGRVGGVAPFDSASETDTAWGIATWLVPEYVAEYYDDDRVVDEMYSCCRWCMEHWIAVAASTGGYFSFDKHGDFGNTNTPPDEYVAAKTQYFYIVALEHTARFAARVGHAADAQRYQGLAVGARELYTTRLCNASVGNRSCFGNCTYPAQIFGLSLGVLPRGGEEEAAAWAHVLQEIGPHATNRANANRFGGGIVTLKLIYPLFQRFGAAALALRTLLHTDRSPSLGFMTTQGGTGPGDAGTTLHEAWNMQNASNGSKPLDALHTLNAYDGPWPGSFNHIMMGSPGRWFYTLFGGIDRDAGTALGSSNGTRSWTRLRLEPPRDPELWSNLTWCSAVLDTVAGQVAVAWRLKPSNSTSGLYALEATVPTNSRATVVVPTVVEASAVTIREGAGGNIVWSKGQFRTVAGIAGGAAGADGRSVELAAGSGRYAFTVSRD
jgi:alpha-L-rhamnosidase